MSSGENLSGSWRVIVVDSVKKQLRRIPRRYAERIEDTFNELMSNPWSGDIDKLGGEENSWRRRVGEYRILFEILSQKRIIFVYDIRRRTSSTY